MWAGVLYPSLKFPRTWDSVHNALLESPTTSLECVRRFAQCVWGLSGSVEVIVPDREA